MSRHIVSPEARQDLREIRNYIGRDSVEAARRVIATLPNSFSKLAEMPEMGRVRTDLSVYSYLVVYRPESRPLQIVRVLHGARDIEVVL